MGVKLIFILLLGILLMNGVYASEFSITSVTKQSSGTPYRQDSVSYKGVIQADSENICKIECSYQVGSDSGFVSDNGESPATQLSKGVSQEFPFSIPAEGSGQVNTNLVVTCNRIPNYVNCWPGSATQQKSISFSFYWPGDGICTTSKEKCEYYSPFLKDDACSCQHPPKECRPNGNRKDLDEKGCQTYCGNGICEKSEGESCIGSNSGGCSDCKKCDLSTCGIGNECEGGYCVWGICWHSSTRLNDGHCDSDKGENCGNSPADCKCEGNTRCEINSPFANYKGCATWCGNKVCEENEKGTCKDDCKWCGDGSCDSSQKESCKTCESDCGVCENQKVNEEIKQKTKEVVETGMKEISDKQKIITYSSLGAIALVVIGYIIFKIVKRKKIKKYKKKSSSND